jgi:site-specific DNA-cytosine methylase
VRCINHWGELLGKLEELDISSQKTTWKDTMPSFPIWGYELDPWHWYPVQENPKMQAFDLENLASERRNLIKSARRRVLDVTAGSVDIKDYPPTGERAWLSKTSNLLRTADWVETWPGYAGKRDVWPRWKQRFIEQNRDWAIDLWSVVDPQWLRQWLDTLYQVIRVPSYQKLEWNCKGEELKIWSHILQFRPSGLRVKRLAHVPALVAMTTTQVPIVPRINQNESLVGAIPGALGRHLIPSEAMQLQGFPSHWVPPPNRERAFTCLGNAVHVGVVMEVAGNWLFGHCRQNDDVANSRIGTLT